MTNAKNPPVIVIVGTTGSGKSSFCNTLYSGYHILHTDTVEELPFVSDSNQSEVCTIDTMKVKTERMFGLRNLFGPCILIDTPGFSDPKDAARAVAFLERIMIEQYITCFAVLTDSNGRFVNKQNLCVLAMLKHIFGEAVFGNIVVIVNKWCMDRESETRKALLKQTKSADPELKMMTEINKVFADLNQKTTGQSIMFTNNFYTRAERFYWEQFECDFAMKVNTLAAMPITKRIIEHCHYYKDDPMKLFNYDTEYHSTPESEKLAKSLAGAEFNLQKLYTVWSGYTSVRLVFVNETEEVFFPSKIETTEGFFETNPENTQKLKTIDLDKLILYPFSVVGIFHHKTWFGAFGVRGEITYLLKTKDALHIKWYVSYSNDRKNPQLEYHGNVLAIYEVSQNIQFMGTDTPIIRITLRNKADVSAV